MFGLGLVTYNNELFTVITITDTCAHHLEIKCCLYFNKLYELIIVIILII